MNWTSDGDIKTDESGNYFIQGFKNMGSVGISVSHDGFERVRVIKELKKGVNVFDFKLNPVQGEKKIPDFFFKEMSTSTAAGSVTFDGCLCPESSFNTDIDLSCKRLSNNEKKRCIKFKDTLDCMNERCKDRKMIKIKCNNCSPDPLNGAVPCGFASAMNVDIKNASEFTMCANANTNGGPLEELTTLFHELFHTCDRESEPNSKRGNPCSEARAHGATACVWDDSYSDGQFDIYNNECTTVTPN